MNTNAELLQALEAAQEIPWVHNAALTGDLEALRKIALAYADWWNTIAWPLIEKTTGAGMRPQTIDLFSPVG